MRVSMRSRTRSTLVATLAAVTLLALLALVGTGCSAETPTTSTEPTPAAPQETPAPEPSVVATPGVFPKTIAGKPVGEVKTLVTEDLIVGTGDEAVAGKSVTVHYTGWLVDGSKFDSSVDGNQPFQFGLGAGMVIPGWEQGVAGMKVGGSRMLAIPGDLGYGAQGAPPSIPPNATLIFQVDLLAVQ